MGIYCGCGFLLVFLGGGMELTEWIPAEIKPARPGWYQCQFKELIPYWRYWNGFEWLMSKEYGPHDVGMYCDLTPDNELISAFGEFPYETNESWRGLAEEPK